MATSLMGAPATSPQNGLMAPSNTIKPSQTLPSVSQTNSNFMAQNPQYGYNGQSNPTSLPSSSMGQLYRNGMVATPNANAVPSQQTAAQNQGWSTTAPVQTSPASPMTPTSSNTQTNTNASTAPQGAYGQVVSNLQNQGTGGNAGSTASQNFQMNQATSPTPASTAINGLYGIATNQTPEVLAAKQQYNTLAQQSPILQAELAGNPNIASEVASGRGQVLGQQLAGQLQGAAQNVQNALTGESQQITAGNNAGNIALGGQSQQITAAQQAGQQALSLQSNQITALQNAGYLVKPYQNGYVVIDPTTGQAVNPYGASSAAFSGGGVGASENQGAQYQNNSATLAALTGSTDGTGTSGMIGNFNGALQQADTNTSAINLGNALLQGLSANTSGAYAGLQNNFQNILAQYAKILGQQTVNQLMTSSQGGTIADFFNSLTQQANLIQGALQTAGTGQTSSAPSSSSTSNATQSNQSNTQPVGFF